MWRLYTTAKASSSRPSELVCIEDRWTAYQLDAAVALVGGAIENAAQELQEVGQGQDKKLVPRYTMHELLDPAFRLPAPPGPKQRERDALAALKALARKRRSGVKLFKVKD